MTPSLDILSFLATYLLHSTLLLGGVWLLLRLRVVRSPSLEDALWKVGLVGGLITASVQVGLGVRPLGGQLRLDGPARHTQEVVSAPAFVHPTPVRAVEGNGLRAGLQLPMASPDGALAKRPRPPQRTGAPRSHDGNRATRVEVQRFVASPRTGVRARVLGAIEGAIEGALAEGALAEGALAERAVAERALPERVLADGALPIDRAALPVAVPAVARRVVGESASFPARPQRTTVTSATAFDWAGLAVGVWLAVSAVGLLRFVRARLGLRRALGRRQDVTDSGVLAILARLVEQGRVRRPVRLSVSSLLAGPVALGREIALPRRALTQLTPRQQEAMLAHELAHIVRRDPFWLQLCALLQAVFCFQPLNQLGRRRLAETSEFLCDDWAVSRTGRGLILAQCLAEVAGWVADTREPELVAGMVRRDSSFLRRVERLARRGVVRTSLRPAHGLLLAALVVGFVSCSVPGVTWGDEDEPGWFERFMTALDQAFAPTHDADGTEVTEEVEERVVFATARDEARLARLMRRGAATDGIEAADDTGVLAQLLSDESVEELLQEVGRVQAVAGFRVDPRADDEDDDPAVVLRIRDGRIVGVVYGGHEMSIEELDGQLRISAQGVDVQDGVMRLRDASGRTMIVLDLGEGDAFDGDDDERRGADRRERRQAARRRDEDVERRREELAERRDHGDRRSTPDHRRAERRDSTDRRDASSEAQREARNRERELEQALQRLQQDYERAQQDIQRALQDVQRDYQRDAQDGQREYERARQEHEQEYRRALQSLEHEQAAELNGFDQERQRFLAGFTGDGEELERWMVEWEQASEEAAESFEEALEDYDESFEADVELLEEQFEALMQAQEDEFEEAWASFDVEFEDLESEFESAYDDWSNEFEEFSELAAYRDCDHDCETRCDGGCTHPDDEAWGEWDESWGEWDESFEDDAEQIDEAPEPVEAERDEKSIVLAPRPSLVRTP